MRRITILTCLLLPCLLFGQTLTQKLVLTDKRFAGAQSPAFDKEGNYCYEVEVKGKQYFITNKGSSAGFAYISSSGGGNGSISYTQSGLDNDDKPWYYRNALSVKVLGPVTGRLEKYITGNTKSNIALTVSHNDSVAYYVNGRQVANEPRQNLEPFDIDHYNWCAFSENGNSIYYVRQNWLYRLYVNGRQIDSSKENFNELHINNNGEYVYAEGRRPDVTTKGYDYMFYIHAGDSVIGPVRTVWQNQLTQKGAYYYSGDDNGPDYIIINNQLKKGIEKVDNIVLPGKGAYYYTFEEAHQQKINVNGKAYSFPLREIILPSVGSNGDFSFYGMIDYFLYPFTNGRQAAKPITRFNVRPTPVYISPQGVSLHYFITDDSVYLYRNDQLLLPPISNQSGIGIEENGSLLDNDFTYQKYSTGNALVCLRYGKHAYWVYNGQLSEPMLPVVKGTYDNTDVKGEIVLGTFDEYGFFAVQKTGDKQYRLNINNKVYKDLENIDGLIDDSYFFNDHQLVLYAKRGSSVYQYNIQF